MRTWENGGGVLATHRGAAVGAGGPAGPAPSEPEAHAPLLDLGRRPVHRDRRAPKLVLLLRRHGPGPLGKSLEHR